MTLFEAFLAPIKGALFVFFLPTIVFVMVGYYLIKKLIDLSKYVYFKVKDNEYFKIQSPREHGDRKDQTS